MKKNISKKVKIMRQAHAWPTALPMALSFYRFMDKVRIGIIGMGNMGRFHANDLLEGKVARGELTAVGSTSPHKLEEYKEKGMQIFGSGEEMIASGAIDALLIATPHYQHTSLGVAALEAGLHIMVEKPISAHKADAERLIAAAAARPAAPPPRPARPAPPAGPSPWPSPARRCGAGP